MVIEQNVQLAPHTTFKIGGLAEYFCVAQSLADVTEALGFAKSSNLPVLVLGGGSNMLVSDRGFAGLVINVVTKGFEIVHEDETSVTIQIASGENWDEVVAQTVKKGWWGIENLSHIPGLAGGLAVQNVGAYGQEASQVITKVLALNSNSGATQEFSNSGCGFSYRKSIFNTSAKGQYIILQTTLVLSKIPRPDLSYGDVAAYFLPRGNTSPSQAEVRQAIIEIRNRKFPYPREAKGGNAGSFFRGPLLSEEKFGALKKNIAEHFGDQALERLVKMQDRLRVPQGFKTPAAFILDLCGLKGHQIGGAQINAPQPAIVLNATGTAAAGDVLDLYRFVQNIVGEKLGIQLEIEPELVGFSPEELHDIIL